MIGKRSFTFGGVNSRTLGVICSGSGTYGAPARDVTAVEVPGRNGTLLIDNGRWKNLTVTYPCSIVRNFPANMAAVRSWLLSRRGYRRLEDGYDTEHYRMAQFCAELSPEVIALGRGGNFDVTFDCKPQRWRTDGEAAVSAVNGGTIENPTAFEALPLITVTGTGAGTLTVGGVTVDIQAMESGLIVLDCEEQNAYSAGGGNLNSVIYAPQFPSLAAGENVISWTGGITGVEVVPRWWEL